NKVIKLVRSHRLFLTLLLVGVFLRTFNVYEWFMYSHDQDLAGWVVRDILENRHLRLIGQETSSKGVFIGSLFYYLQIPFYVVFGMDPAGSVWLPIIISVFSMWSIYFVFTRVFGKVTAIIATLIYALSYFVVFNDRELVPTQPVMLWTMWYLYSLWLVFKGKQKAYVLVGLLWGLVWHLSLALAILAPLALVAQVFSKTKVNFKYLVFGAVVFVVWLSPFAIFEYRHNFQQVKAITASFTTNKDHIQGTSDTRLEKLDRTMQIVNKNVDGLFWNHSFNVPAVYTLYLLVVLFVILAVKKIIPLPLAVIFTLWMALYIAFFTFNSINISEYYLNGMNIIWIAIFSLFVSQVFKHRKNLAIVILLVFVFVNIKSYLQKGPNESGYLQRKALVDFITQDSKNRGYQCVAVSYITSPGNNLGYRMFFYLNKLHVNQPKSGSPVYTIVFPHSMVDRIDKSFGALGLVLPDYERYSEEQIKVSCSGENANLTDPMFGFTK
ncbi:MAG: glycosyltransferase family 39 protein, partial [Patescibacteria group bacterium]